jgi:hypothetical protein
MNTHGHEALGAWQTGGSGRSEGLGCKLFHVEPMPDLRRLNEPTGAPQPHYEPDNRHVDSVWCQS